MSSLFFGWGNLPVLGDKKIIQNTEWHFWLTDLLSGTLYFVHAKKIVFTFLFLYSFEAYFRLGLNSQVNVTFIPFILHYLGFILSFIDISFNSLFLELARFYLRLK